MGSVFSFCLDYSYPFNCSLTLYTMRLEIITIDMSYVFRVRAIAIAGAHCKTDDHLNLSDLLYRAFGC